MGTLVVRGALVLVNAYGPGVLERDVIIPDIVGREILPEPIAFAVLAEMITLVVLAEIVEFVVL